MPREVFLEPNGSPFVHNAHINYGDQSMAGDSTLTDLSFQDNDNLLNASAFAGLADVTAGGIGDDTSMMKMEGSGNASEDMLMGVNGDEFLEDDSMAFELSKSTTTTRARSKVEQSTTAAPAPVTAPVVEEKPKARRSTRSRSSSPSKKRSSAATTPTVEETATFPVAQIQTMPEEPEPEPEPKLRRSPRKARSTSTRLGSSVSTGISPFASTSSSPAPENPPPAETSQPTEPEPEPEPKSRRGSRLVGRSKSKSRAKSARLEEPLSEEPKAEDTTPVADPTVSTPVVEREVIPVVREATPIARDTTPALSQHQATPPAPSPPVHNTPPTASKLLSPTSQTPQIPIQATSFAVSPDAPPTGSWLAPATRQSLAPSPVSRQSPAPTPATSSFPTGRQSLAPTQGPAPFKFNLPPSFGRRTQSLAPTPAFPTTPGFPTTPSFATVYTPAISNPVSALPSPAFALATPGPTAAPRPVTPEEKEEDLKYEQLSKEEEEEAIAAAMRITRRDSSIFAAILSPARPSLAPKPKLPADDQEQEQQEDRVCVSPNAIGEVPPTEPASVLKRTRVGRGSTRVKGGAGVAVAVMGRVDEDMDMERVEPQVVPQGQEQEHVLGEQRQELAHEQEQDVLEEEKHILGEQQDIDVPVNFGSRSPSPTPPPPPPEESGPSVSAPTKNGSKPRTRTTRASMPTAQPARVTRSTRRSEVQLPTSRGLGSTAKAKETLIEKLFEMEIDEDAQNDDAKPAEDVSTPTEAADLPTSTTVESITPLNPILTIPHNVISTTPADSPVVSTPEGQAPAPSKTTVPKKASGTKGPQRVLTRTVPAAAASQQNTSGSGPSQSHPRRTASSGLTKPPSTGSAKPPSAGAKPASAEGSQQQAGGVVQKSTTKSAAPRKPASTSSQPSSTTHKEHAVDKEPLPVPEPPAPVKELEPEGRAVRTLPKRVPQPSTVSTIMEDSMEISREEISVDLSAEQFTPVQYTAPAPTAASIWPREPAPNPFAPVKSTIASNEDSPKTNKRRAPSPEPEPESTPQDVDVNDSPNKRVRFTAVLEAGPTPGIGRVMRMPKPSLKKIKKIKLERKAKTTTNAGRPKRVLTRDWVVGSNMPSYAAPLKRDVREREPATERPTLAESQTNPRATTSKVNPTVPIPFTFRSELRMKPRSTEDPPLPAAIPIAAPMPDFAAVHAAAEAANLVRRQRAHEAFLAAQAELESQRDSNYAIGGETARRAAERAVFDAATKVKEAEAERVRNEQKRIEAEKEAAAIREMRRRMVPKANPLPEFYKYAPRIEAQDSEM
ncbi:unnamed protein product [Rhizoctonia solani]|uniref:TPX2 C-terminal domain-containing protein n=1 Tax=Rhizoctonia solani TaxID=456999 RepID=A0A8H2W9N5_9AGAM|nr:unnamed protein product [Rhizoctonia solani]